MTQTQEWMGTTQASRLLGVQPKTLTSWLDKGLMPRVRTRKLPTGRVQLNREDIQEFVDTLNGESR
jgi:excisionase family DNA binding protein